MKYFLIAGEASGDLHASRLMRAIKERDPKAEYCFFGGDRMSAVGGVRIRHYKNIAYMGFIAVLLHARTILKGMRTCRQCIMRWHPDVVILVDYPGFNLSIAKYVRTQTEIPVYYYISPKIWAWKEHRIRDIRAYVNQLFSILPFEVPFFEQKHHYPIHYVGNPSVDEISEYVQRHPRNIDAFFAHYRLDEKPVIALLPGSRRQEIKDNLAVMCRAAKPYLQAGYQVVVAGVSDISEKYYRRHYSDLFSTPGMHFIVDDTLRLLQHAEVALVTSGTATLETALMRVPQVVCYYAPLGPLVRFLKKHLLKVPYISLVNLIVDREVVPELIGDKMCVSELRCRLALIVKGGEGRAAQLNGYEDMINRLGPAGAPQRAADIMLQLLQNK